MLASCARMPAFAAVPSYHYSWRGGGHTDDPSVQWLGASEKHRVYCDGQDLTHRAFAVQSGTEGWVDQYETDGNGRVLVDETGRAPRVKRTHGNVVLELDPQAIVRVAA